MRKFKLTEKAARRMRGLTETSRTEKKPEGTEKESPRETEQPSRRLKVTSRTDVGLVRKNNQDAVILGGELFGIADGMGGHNGGETASAGAREGMLRETRGQEPTEKNLEEAIRKVNLALWDRSREEEGLSGMGTTLTVLWPAEDRMLIGHVGDSRAYLLRDGKLRQVTRDHSMVADMVRRGLLTEEQAACHPMRNYITRAVGTEETVQADVLAFERQRGDRWLVCSDGLHGLVEKQRLQELMAMADPEEAADQMVREALDRGGRDNISLVLAVDEEARAEEAAE